MSNPEATEIIMFTSTRTTYLPKLCTTLAKWGNTRSTANRSPTTTTVSCTMVVYSPWKLGIGLPWPTGVVRQVDPEATGAVRQVTPEATGDCACRLRKRLAQCVVHGLSKIFIRPRFYWWSGQTEGCQINNLFSQTLSWTILSHSHETLIDFDHTYIVVEICENPIKIVHRMYSDWPFLPRTPFGWTSF